ncbi:ATP-binding cassette domain-containing protein [Anaerococcus porci]|uniref:ABC transporter ATP-binding protein n=1 Tax=Anaerococcus porci TaxID=2652269 RepID=UPI002A752CC9|nr:ATP-binding cassette domain-containing protein [Anaerococcus porci]MDY3005622.1 ATP-binding cassette domain-containing protein [Anaerococcus porci]
MENILDLEIESFSYDEKIILKDIKLSIKKGELLLLTGSSGCGKSTLIRLMNGLIPEFYEGNLKGDIKLKGKPLTEYKKGELAKYIGNVFQNPKDQFFCTIVEDEIALVGENLGMPSHELIKRVNEVLDLLEIKHLRYKSIFDLSGGERQKVAIACTLVYDTDLIFFDEPSSSLDYKSIENLKEIFCILKNLGKTIVVADHRIYYLKDLFDHLVLMNQGTIKSVYTNGELTSNMCRNLGLRTIDEDILKSEKKPINGKELFSINNINILQNSKILIKNISFKLFEKEIMGVIGANGVGKTTLAKNLSGLLGGTKNITYGYKEKERLKNSYFVFQDVDSQLFLDTVENDLLAGIDLDDNEVKDLARNYLKTINLWENRTSHPQKLSEGQKQRLAVIEALISKRKVIILDEPSSGLDYISMNIMAELLNLISEKQSIILISHDMELIFKICNSVLLLDRQLNKKISVKGNEYKIFKFLKSK